MEPVCPLDMSGRFTEEVTDFKGMHVKVRRTRLHPIVFWVDTLFLLQDIFLSERFYL